MVATINKRSNATYADTTENYAYLNTDFGLNLALKKFDITLEQLESIVGRYKKGSRVGQLKGKLVWRKLTAGGWYKSIKCVVPPGVTYGYRIVEYNGETIFPEYIKNMRSYDITTWEDRELYRALCDKFPGKKETETETETEQEKNKRKNSENIEECRKEVATKESNEIWYNTLLKRYRKFKCEPLKDGETPEQFNNRICDALYEI